MKYGFLIFFVVLVCLAEGQGGFRSRIRVPGAANHRAKAIFEVSPGNYFAAGFARDTTSQSVENKLTVMGLDSAGKLSWFKQYGSPDFQYFNNPFIFRSYYKYGDNIYYAGCAKDTSNKQIGVLIKFDFNGDTVWQRVFRDPDPQEDVIPQMVTASIDGGFLITGFFQHWTNHTRHGLLIKTDDSGNELWRKKVSKGNPEVQDGKAIVQDSATGKIVLVGYQYKPQPGSFGNVVVLDSFGNEVNRQAFILGVITDLVQLRDGSFALTGFAETSHLDGSVDNRGYIARFTVNTGPFPDWNIKLLPESGLGCLKVHPDGQIYTAGWVRQPDTVHYMDHELVRISKIDTSGSVIWHRTYDYKDNAANMHFMEGIRSFEFTSDGGIVAAIELFHAPLSHPFFFVKYDSTGCDSTTAYCESLVAGTGESQNAAPADLVLSPNPASDKIRVSYAGVCVDGCELTVTDVAGKVVLTVEQRPPTFTVDVGGLQSGIYLVMLREEGGRAATQKLLIQR